ncbi:MAG TPA: PQQ-binding-like beta-propeller repeat protein, partial [Haliangiales bacterium]|nr:PQQ-binding-like beta-propeller repeat protein [Haliangiales bacterium]
MLWAGTASAGTVTGTVFVDLNGDGKLGPGEAPVAGVVVVYEASVWTQTDAAGRFSLVAPVAGIVWARIPDGYSPEPVWTNVPLGDVDVALPLRPAAATGPVRFIATADSHLGMISTLETQKVLEQAVVTAPHFWTVLGDVSDASVDAQMAMLNAARAMTTAPFVPVLGNHDAYDGGAAFRKAFGPTQRSFDSGGVHFIILDIQKPAADAHAFIQKDLGYPHGDPVVAFQHYPLTDAYAAQLASWGVSYAFTAHTHSNRIVHRPDITEYATEPLTFGGLDWTPAGYRVVSLDARGRLHVDHHTVVAEPVVELVHPRPGLCLASGDVRIVAAVEGGPGDPDVTLTVGGKRYPMAATGGWTYQVRVALPAGAPDLEVEAVWPTRSQTAQVTACVKDTGDLPPVGPTWTQLQGSADHHGAIREPLAPPMWQLWARPTGGHILEGSPIVADGVVFVGVVDLAAGDRGGLLALDARTGGTLWHFPTGVSVRNAPAVAAGHVIFASDDGVVHAVDPATALEAWSVDIGLGVDDLYTWLYAAPTVSGGVVYIGNEARFFALDAATGAELWSFPGGDTIPSTTLAAAGLGGGIGVSVVGRGRAGIVGWDAGSGTSLWKISGGVATALNASPVIDGDRVYLSGWDAHACAVDLLTGLPVWQMSLYADPYDLVYVPTATPALANGVLYVPTPHSEFYAVDAGSGAVRWMIGADPSVIRPLPYGRAGHAAYLGSPAVAGSLVWFGGADGKLRALDAATGDEVLVKIRRKPSRGGLHPIGKVLQVLQRAT